MRRSAGFTSNTVPWEILRAAGYEPVLLEAEPGPTPHADRFMEDLFDPRIRSIFDRICSGQWNRLDLVVIPRTSEQEHKLYLYLREAARNGTNDGMPRLYLYNLLHTRFPESYEYGLERTREMARCLGSSDEALLGAIQESNQARACIRELLHKRREGLLEGSAALDLIHGFYTENRAQYVERMANGLEGMSVAIAGDRPRILIKGAPLPNAALHRSVEESGGYVIAEDDWRGSRAAGDSDVRLDDDPVMAIFDKYFYDELSPRVYPADRADAWFHRQVEAGHLDGVLFFIPLDDDVVGWDYPRQAAFLERSGVPSVVVREANDSSAIAAFIRGLDRR